MERLQEHFHQQQEELERMCMVSSNNNLFLSFFFNFVIPRLFSYKFEHNFIFLKKNFQESKIHSNHDPSKDAHSLTVWLKKHFFFSDIY